MSIEKAIRQEASFAFTSHLQTEKLIYDFPQPQKFASYSLTYFLTKVEKCFSSFSDTGSILCTSIYEVLSNDNFRLNLGCRGSTKHEYTFAQA